MRGIVQGVGFRPYVFQLANRNNLKGWVHNSAQGVSIEVEGEAVQVENFLKELQEKPPRLARIVSISSMPQELKGYHVFEIKKSSFGEERNVLISPDIAICDDCRREIATPEDRRYRYPFTNCTNCGPRFSIIKDVPYDRERTSMASFPMCLSCGQEYHDPADRRFHAQPTACYSCGPQVFLLDGNGKTIPGDWALEFKRLILAGKIVAVKGIGGVHLACDARNQEVITQLRRRKNRPAKPFAVMCHDMRVVRRFCLVSQEEARALQGPEAPIVVLKRKPENLLPQALAPNLDTLGVMLPYSPLHLMLFGRELDILVMTSGNIADLPLIKDNDAAIKELQGIADYFLLHDREIEHRCDDSLVRVIEGEIHFYRRSRGFTPKPIQIPDFGKELRLLGAGGEMKNAFCLVSGNQAFFSQHLGEINSLESMENYMLTLKNLQKLVNIEPQIIAHDLHPNYQVSELVKQLPVQRLIGVQHHHAHMAACMADNELSEEVIGVICDGTGYGADGRLWGFEVLTGDYLSFQRNIHLGYIPVPGGEAAVKNPVRMAITYLLWYLGQDGKELAHFLFPGRKGEVILTEKLLTSRINTPVSSSCGRLFDAVSALLNVCLENTYEGQAAIELGELIRPRILACYPFAIKDGIIHPANTIKGLVEDLLAGEDKRTIATKFQNTVSEMIVQAVARISETSSLKKVVLSGGVFQNPYLLQKTREGLCKKGFMVYGHRQVPANDGGLALGQAMVAYRRCVFDVFGGAGASNND